MSRSREEILKEIAKLKKELGDVPCEFCGGTPIYAKGLCRNCYHRYLRNGSAEYAKKKKKPDVEEIPYRIKIAKKVLGNISYPVPPDFDESVDYALGTLRERERDVVERNAKGETMREIAKTYGVSGQFISWLSAKAYRKLSRRNIAYRIKFGVKKAEEIEEKERKEILERENKDLETLSGHPIEILDLSVRAYNGLKRSGVDTVESAYKMCLDGSILSVKNIGNNTAREINEKIESFLAKTK